VQHDARDTAAVRLAVQQLLDRRLADAIADHRLPRLIRFRGHHPIFQLLHR